MCATGPLAFAPTTTASDVVIRSFVNDVAPPCGPGSLAPNLTVGRNDRLILSWLETAGEGHRLQYCVRDGDAWTAPREVAQGSDWFVNWADFPSVVGLGDGALIAHWLAKSGPDTYAYDVHIALSRDGGKKWTTPILPHRDDTKTEHGFVSILPWTRDRALAVWLDGRNFAGENPTKNMTLRSATIDLDGRVADDVELDDRICECCATAAALTATGAIVVYRNRSDEEIRDIWIVRYHDGRWLEPRPLYMDGWMVPGCPVNGPAIDARDNRVAVAWYTAAGNSPRVKVVLSDDGGASFGKPVLADDGRPLGRTDIVVLPDGTALVSWLERTDTGASIKVRRVRDGRPAGQSMTVSESSAESASGFPRMAQLGDEVYFAWTDTGDESRVRVAAVRYINVP